MGSLASSLCCSSETSHESDGIQKQTPQNMPTAKSSQDAKRVLRKAQETSTSISKSGQKTHLDSTNNKSKPAKGVAEDDNSVNESDTLSVTNEEAKQLDNKTEENSKDENMTGESGASKIDISQNAASEEIARMHENGVSQQNGITQSNGVTQKNESENDNDNDNEFGNSNEDNHFEKDSAIDVRSTFDLSAIQENQSFNPETGYLLGKKDVSRFGNKKCLVLDLDETLVHSSFKYIRTADFVIPVEIEDQVHHVYVIKRPGVDEFLRRVGQWYEVVVFTASVAKYGDPLLNKLDVHHAVHQRLFRDSCYSYQGNFIKNLSQLGRPLAESIIIDNSPASYIFHPQHSVPISSWFSDTHDNELLDLLPLLKDLSKPNVDDVSLVLDTTM